MKRIVPPHPRPHFGKQSVNRPGDRMQSGQPFLGCIMMNGTHFTDDHIATGFGNHLARPLFREAHRPDMSAEEAEELLKRSLR